MLCSSALMNIAMISMMNMTSGIGMAGIEAAVNPIARKVRKTCKIVADNADDNDGDGGDSDRDAYGGDHGDDHGVGGGKYR